jgi:hypothetical protein
MVNITRPGADFSASKGICAMGSVVCAIALGAATSVATSVANKYAGASDRRTIAANLAKTDRRGFAEPQWIVLFMVIDPPKT